MRDIYRIRIIVVDDETKILNNIVSKIKSVMNECDIVATATNGRDALKAVDEYRPHIVFTDIKMQGMDGLQLSKEIKAHFPGIYVVIISGFSDFTFAQQAIKYGVFNYLLKPVEKDKLIDTLNDIRDKLEVDSVQSNRSIVLPNKMKLNSNPLDEVFRTDYYGIFVLCFNNLCYDNLDDYLIDYYKKFFYELDWDNIIKELKMNITSWIIVDEYNINQKNIIIGIDNKELNFKDIARRLTMIIGKKYPQFLLNICCHKKFITRNDIWLYTQRMRNVLQNSVVITSPKIFVMEKDENHVYMDYLYTIKSRIDNNLKSYIKAKKYDKLYKEIREILSYLSRVNINQKQYEKVLVNILQIFEFYMEGYDTIWSEKLQIDLFRTMSLAKDYKEIEKIFLECINNFMNDNQSIMKTKEIQEEILNYVDKNYIKINKVEEVAKIFNYNYTYLSRLFKKMTGTTMSKYITSKRIEAAKTIIEQNDNIGIGTVGQMVGYEDQHYFSRTFKLITGISPSEYKNQVEL